MFGCPNQTVDARVIPRAITVSRRSLSTFATDLILISIYTQWRLKYSKSYSNSSGISKVAAVIYVSVYRTRKLTQEEESCFVG